jgi:hypothetical protein
MEPAAVDFHQFADLAVSLEVVRQNFERYGLLDEQVRFLPGWFRDTLPGAPIESLSIMRLDGDMYESTMDGLVHLHPKLSPADLPSSMITTRWRPATRPFTTIDPNTVSWAADRTGRLWGFLEKDVRMTYAVVSVIGLEVGEGVAAGRTYFTARNILKDGTPFAPMGMYFERFVQEGDMWRFKWRLFQTHYVGPPDLTGTYTQNPDYGPSPAMPPLDAIPEGEVPSTVSPGS